MKLNGTIIIIKILSINIFHKALLLLSRAGLIPPSIYAGFPVNRIVDIGANTGIYSILAAKINKTCKVFSFEPMPSSYNALVRNIGINNYEDVIVSIKKAVSNANGVTQFNIPFNSVFSTSASLDVNGFRGYKGSTIKVDIVTMDSFFINTNHRIPDLIKIDVEGFENKTIIPDINENYKNWLCKVEVEKTTVV